MLPSPLEKEVRMFAYRIYKISSDDHIAGPPVEVECVSDQEAIAQAKQVLNGLDIEVWQGARVVTRLQSRDK
jgi:hypothetical protein